MLCLNLSYLREYQTRESSTIYCRISVLQKTAGWFGSCLLPLQRQIRLPIYFRIARRCPHLPHGLSITDGGSHGVGFLRPFSRDQGGQDRLRENSDLFFRPIIDLVNPFSVIDAVVIRNLKFPHLHVFPNQRFAHVVNHMSGVTQVVGNITHERGNLTQVFGRTSHV